MEEKNVETKKIVVKDENDIERFVIASKLPDPRIDGKIYHRDVQVSGMQILDDCGDEIGGIGIIDKQRTAVLGLDYKNHEAITAFVYDNQDGHGAGISVNSKDTTAKVDGAKHYSKILIKAENDSTTINFIGRDGKEKMLIGLDENDNPYIRIANKKGNFIDVLKDIFKY